MTVPPFGAVYSFFSFFFLGAVKVLDAAGLRLERARVAFAAVPRKVYERSNDNRPQRVVVCCVYAAICFGWNVQSNEWG